MIAVWLGKLIVPQCRHVTSAKESEVSETLGPQQ